MLTPERKLAVAAVAIAGIIGLITWIGGASSWQYYLTVDECQAGGTSLTGKRVRVAGAVAARSLVIAKNRSAATFTLEGSDHGLDVSCSGPLPDNLAEGMQVVVEGEFPPSGPFRGEHVLTRCASKYQAQDTALAQGPSSSGREAVR